LVEDSNPIAVPAVPPGGRRLKGRILLLIILGYATLLRTWDLSNRPYWVDEAESSINALTILQHGVPTDTYLGLPIYENTLTRPWPESPEYEFKDSSYSKKGLAIYHGWLPLYCIAAAFKTAHVEPDTNVANLSVAHTAAEMRLRTMIGRLPSVGFGALFLIAVFHAARIMYGRDAAWTALVAATVSDPAIEFSRQARYYAATSALTTCCCLVIWLMIRRGRWRDFILAALVFVALFYTHILSFAITCGAATLALPGMWKHRHIIAKLALFGTIVSAGVAPWIVLTGFLDAAPDIPKAITLFKFPQDLVAYPLRQWPFTALALLTLGWLTVAGLFRRKLPARLVDPFLEHRAEFLFLAGWAVIGFLAFIFLMPAASYFSRRMTLTLMGPGILFGAMLFCATARVLTPRHAALAASLMFVGAMLIFGKVSFWWAEKPNTVFVYDVLERLREMPIPAGTRVYATPNDQLILTFYTGIPVQNIAPVRKSFIDSYPGDLMILEAGPRYEKLDPDEVRRAATAQGIGLSESEAKTLSLLLPSQLVRQELRGRVARVTPAPETLPAYMQAIFLAQKQKTVLALTKVVEHDGNPMFKGFPLNDFNDWWQIFFYRFVGPDRRRGANLNYAGRIRFSHAHVLPLEWILYHCPPRNQIAGPGRDG
jgi:hypothetical protein